MKVTKAQLQDPKFCSYEKSVAIGEVPIDCECGECGAAALIMPAITMRMPPTGVMICPRCWHPMVGRMLLTIAEMGGAAHVPWKKYAAVVEMLCDLGLLKKRRGHNYELTPAALSVLWVKERSGWEFETAHSRGWYRSENLPGIGWATGYWSHGDMGQWIHHRHGRHARKPWPIGGIGVLRFESRRAA